MTPKLGALWGYRSLTKQLLRLRAGEAWTEEAEDRILDEMDDAWNEMTDEERATANADGVVV